MAGRFQKATRKKLKLRAAIDGPSGSGKSYTALAFARALAGPTGRIACIDTEHGALSKYAGVVGGDFDVLELTSFSPSEYVAAIEEAGSAGYDVIVIDSLSHAWEGKDGALELVDKVGRNGNSYTAWKDVTPMHRRMIEAILASPAHVIGTMRSKVEHVLEKDEKTGKMTPKKIGMAPVQRQGMEYEFDLYGSMDHSHILTISKSRCPAVDGAVAVKPGEGFLSPVIEWLNTGVSAPAVEVTRIQRIDEATIQAIVERAVAAGITPAKLIEQLPSLARVTELSHLLVDQVRAVEQWIDGEGRKKSMAAAKRSTGRTISGSRSLPASNETRGDVRARIKDDDGPTTDDQLDSLMGTDANSPERSGVAPSDEDPSTDGGSVDATGPRDEQIEAIRDLKERLDRVIGSPDWYGKALAKRKVKTARQLTPDQAAEMIANMQRVLLEKTQGDENSPDWAGPPACSWPRVMQSMVSLYGAAIVWDAGLDVLGYPPTWAHQVAEANRVSDKLKELVPAGTEEGGE